MTRARYLIGVGLLAALCGTSTGCSGVLHDLQWHRLHRLNRQPPVHEDPYNWSVPDPPLPADAGNPVSTGNRVSESE